MQSRHMAKPTTVHMAGGKIILPYLRGAPNLPTIYDEHSTFNLVGFCDASYGQGDPKKLRWVTGSMLFIAGGLVHFPSQLQNISAQSITESEIIAINSCGKQAFTCRDSLANWAGSTSEPARFHRTTGALSTSPPTHTTRIETSILRFVSQHSVFLQKIT